MTNTREELSELFRLARRYGLVYIYTSKDGTYSCTIKFNTIDHTELDAKSGFNHNTPEAAVEAAIKTAQKIVESISNMKLPERKWLT